MGNMLKIWTKYMKKTRCYDSPNILFRFEISIKLSKRFVNN